MSFKPKAVLLAMVLLCGVLISGCAPVSNLVSSADDWIKTHIW